jgi:arabinosyltransferase C
VPELSDEQQLTIFRTFTKWLAIAVTLLVGVPTLYGYLIRPSGSLYLGIQYNLDDHMVYAGWMKQAMEGHLTFENRFTTDQQPGLTLHLYFLVLGWIAKVLGIPITMTLARLGFTFLSVTLLGRFVEFVTERIFPRKLALAMATLGGGIGFLVWHNFGKVIVKPGNDLLSGLLLSRLPNDVWQPEGFFLSSAITNGLFMASLCLILGTFISVLKAKTNARAVIPGAICFGLLMNIHSYDVLLVCLCLVGFAVALGSAKLLNLKWAGRTTLICLGAVPFALWFLYVIRNDQVFQARALTLTYSPNFRQIFAGYILLIVPGIIALFDHRKNVILGIGVMVSLLIVLNLAASTHLKDEYFMLGPMWILAYAAVLVSLYLIKPEKPGLALVAAWAFVGIIAPYFPSLFQRKLTMMLSVPWGILAGIGIAMLLEKQERGQRNLLTTLCIIVFSASGLRWISREIYFAKRDVSNTTVHSIYYSQDIESILDIMKPLGPTATIGAMPGIPIPSQDDQNKSILDSYEPPFITDLNPIFVGLAGTKLTRDIGAKHQTTKSKEKKF